MGLYDSWLSLWRSLWLALGLKGKEGTLLLLGLDNAGKTTLLYRLRTGGLRNFPPTDRPDCGQSFNCEGVSFRAWDLGGHEAVRHLWQDYVVECKAILFLIDAADSYRMEEVGFELDALIQEGVLEGLPVALLLNKCDLETAMPSEQVMEIINYKDLAQTQGQDKMRVFRISVMRGEGYQEAFRWVASFM